MCEGKIEPNKEEENVLRGIGSARTPQQTRGKYLKEIGGRSLQNVLAMDAPPGYILANGLTCYAVPSGESSSPTVCSTPS